MQYNLLITVENNRRLNQNHGSWRIKYFFLISRRIISENHGSRLLMKSRFTRKKQTISHFTGKKLGHSRITKIPFTTFFKARLRYPTISENFDLNFVTSRWGFPFMLFGLLFWVWIISRSPKYGRKIFWKGSFSTTMASRESCDFLEWV